MTDLHAQRSIAATPERLAEILRNIAELPDWNPAVLRTDTAHTAAVVGQPYAVTTRIPGPASLTYERVEPRAIVWRLRVAGGVELGEWTLERSGGGTHVTHAMHHTGPVFALLRTAMRPVPELRLDRLARRAAEG